MNPDPSESASPGRLDLAKLARKAKGGLVDVGAAAEALAIPRRMAALRLASLARRGWLRRVRRGLYLIVPLESEPGRPVAAEDPWLVAQAALAPCYIGGWSAAEHWGLTEQIFRSTLVVTAAPVRARTVALLGHEFRLYRVPRVRIEGVAQVWRGSEQVPVSSRERTIVDGLYYPALCGGIRHLADIMREYGEAPDHDFRRLAAEARQAGAGVVWKRLGYLAEVLWPAETWLVEEAKRKISTGNVKLDPGVAHRGKLASRWHLWINVQVGGGARAA